MNKEDEYQEKEETKKSQKRKKPARGFLFAFITAFCIAAVYVYLIMFFHSTRRANLVFEDFLFQLRHQYYEKTARSYLEPKDIVILSIDLESYRYLRRRWPWSRDIVANFLDKLHRCGPKTIAIEVPLYSPTPKNPEADLKLADTIKLCGNVILASAYGREKAYPEPYDIFIFVKASAGYGIVGIERDSDNIIRRTKPFTFILSPREGGEASFEIKVLANFLGIEENKIYKEKETVILRSKDKYIRIPTDKKGNLLINYLSDEEDIKIIPMWKLDTGEFPKDIFKNKIVLISQIIETFQELYPTPFGYRPGGLIIANELNSILTSYYAKRENPIIYIPVVFAVCVVAFIYFYRMSPLKGFFILILLLSSYLTGVFILFLNGRIWPIFDIIVLLPIFYMSMTFQKYGNVVYERSEIKRLAITDSLTGLHTHRYFRFLLDHTVSKALTFGQKCSLVIIKILNLDRIVKELSFHKGQMIQREIAKLIKMKLPNETSGAYLGMGEFCMLLPKVGLYEALGIAGSLRKHIEEASSHIAEDVLRPGVAMGVSEVNPAGFPKTGIELMRSARAAMARAREFGHNKVCRFNPKIDSSVFEPDIMEREIRQRLDDEFSFLVIDLEERNKELENLLHQLSVTQRDLEQAHFETLRSLIVALEEKDPCTAGHSERVGMYAEKIGIQLKMPEEEVRILKQAAVLHDIGKVGISQGILRKEDTLDHSERAIIELHPEFSVRILNTSKYFSRMLHAIRDHHERLDGSGYPRGLKGDQISLEAQMIAVCDAYDAMTADRPYRKAFSPIKAINEILTHSEKYNHTVAIALRRVLREEGKIE